MYTESGLVPIFKNNFPGAYFSKIVIISCLVVVCIQDIEV